MSYEERFSRNIALFGQEGQKRISASRVAVVGLGGLGSHIAQQLAYLGVRDLAFIDDDIVTMSSMNRVVGALHEDVAAETRKVTVAERVAKAVDRDGRIAAVPGRLETPHARAAIARSDSVFSCLDDDRARLALVDVCARERIPFFDLATDTGVKNGGWYGGRVMFSGYGDRCPSCMQLLDQEAMAIAGMDAEQREADERIYGVSRDSLGGTGPSVVSLNGVVASLAVTEWTVWRTELREPVALLEYRGHLGPVFVNNDPPGEGCYYCALWRC